MILMSARVIIILIYFAAGPIIVSCGDTSEQDKLIKVNETNGLYILHLPF